MEGVDIRDSVTICNLPFIMEKLYTKTKGNKNHISQYILNENRNRFSKYFKVNYSKRIVVVTKINLASSYHQSKNIKVDVLTSLK